jgi:hypothetical protein
MDKNPIKAQEDYTLEGVIKYLKGIRDNAGKTLTKVKRVQKGDYQKLRAMKDETPPFHEGQRVICHWGSAGYTQKGTVVDPFAMYNGYMKWSKNSEYGAVIRLDEKTLPTGVQVTSNEVLPWTVIKPIASQE